jgi:geranylgeranyl reductase family protein
MRDDYDVVVVGAGPGGATAATELGRAGVRTLLVDKARFPRDKACGDAVCSRSVSVLRELGLLDAVAKLPGQRVLTERFLNDRGEGLELPFLFARGAHAAPTPEPAYVVPRLHFDNLLFEHARSFDSVDVLEGFTLTDLRFEEGRVTGVAGRTREGPRTFRARIVIGADGAFSKVAEKVGAYDFHHKHHEHWIAAFRIYFDDVSGLGDALEIHFLDRMLPGYLWIFPEGRGRANVGAGMVESFARGEKGQKVNLKQVGYALLANHPVLGPRFKNAREHPGSFLGWQLPCGSERRDIAGRGWMLVGDAASLIDPFSGEGIANAMVSAQLAARTAVESLRQGASLEMYAKAVWAELGAELKTSTRLQRLARHTWLVKWLLHRAATRPRLQAELTSLKVHDRGERLTHPLYLARTLAL